VTAFFAGDEMYAAVNGGVAGNIYTAAFIPNSWLHDAPAGSRPIGTTAVEHTFTTGGGTGSISPPSYAVMARLQAWGAGGGASGGGWGGGGGGYAESNIPLTSQAVYYLVGQGGEGNTTNVSLPYTAAIGQSSWARVETNSRPTSNSEGAAAPGGYSGNFQFGSDGTTRIGGSGAGVNVSLINDDPDLIDVETFVGTTTYNGGSANHASSWEGGGGGAGSGGNGSNSSSATDGIGGAGGSPDGGAGGDGSQTVPTAGTAPGGGGGSSDSSPGGQAGAAGQVKITFYYYAEDVLLNSIISNLVKFSQNQLSYPSEFKTITIPNPVVDDSVTAFWTPEPLNISEIRSVVRGSSSPQANFTIASGPSRDGTGNTVMQANIACSNVTSGNLQTSFSNTSIAANSFVWVNVLTTSGTVTELNITMRF
jgi:hypothetical protein